MLSFKNHSGIWENSAVYRALLSDIAAFYFLDVYPPHRVITIVYDKCHSFLYGETNQIQGVSQVMSHKPPSNNFNQNIMNTFVHLWVGNNVNINWDTVLKQIIFLWKFVIIFAIIVVSISDLMAMGFWRRQIKKYTTFELVY